jgi:hypothetical protein
MELEWITPQQAADEWGVSARRVQALCINGQIENAKKIGRIWLIPQNTTKPVDGRKNNGRNSKIKL